MGSICCKNLARCVRDSEDADRSSSSRLHLLNHEKPPGERSSVDISFEGLLISNPPTCREQLPSESVPTPSSSTADVIPVATNTTTTLGGGRVVTATDGREFAAGEATQVRPLAAVFGYWIRRRRAPGKGVARQQDGDGSACSRGARPPTPRQVPKFSSTYSKPLSCSNRADPWINGSLKGDNDSGDSCRTGARDGHTPVYIYQAKYERVEQDVISVSDGLMTQRSDSIAPHLNRSCRGGGSRQPLTADDPSGASATNVDALSGNKSLPPPFPESSDFERLPLTRPEHLGLCPSTNSN